MSLSYPIALVFTCLVYHKIYHITFVMSSIKTSYLMSCSVWSYSVRSIKEWLEASRLRLIILIAWQPYTVHSFQMSVIFFRLCLAEPPHLGRSIWSIIHLITFAWAMPCFTNFVDDPEYDDYELFTTPSSNDLCKQPLPETNAFYGTTTAEWDGTSFSFIVIRLINDE